MILRASFGLPLPFPAASRGSLCLRAVTTRSIPEGSARRSPLGRVTRTGLRLGRDLGTATRSDGRGDSGGVASFTELHRVRAVRSNHEPVHQAAGPPTAGFQSSFTA